MFVIGISGGIGCGKSTAAEYFRLRGIPVLDADEISRNITREGGEALPDLVKIFGEECLDEHGALDRQRMSRLAFADKRLLDELSAIVHAHVINIMGKAIDKEAAKKTQCIVLDVPIPVQHGFLDRCDFVLIIQAEDSLRIERLRARGMDEAEAARRIAMQMTAEEYAALANELILNNGEPADLERQLDDFCERELAARGIVTKLK